MAHVKQITATHNDNPDCSYVWTDDSEHTLEQWKAHIEKRLGEDFTYSEPEDNPETATRQQIKQVWEQVRDPAAKKILKLLLKEFIGDHTEQEEDPIIVLEDTLDDNV
tara:strand:- start:2049 stop:2372 length:324 start_codon:yes stop_codon:yes gene_type:complete